MNIQWTVIVLNCIFKNNNTEINLSTLRNNKSGEVIKVIIGSPTVAEGLDFKRIREVHIMDPWYHLNKLEQIIGRGIRFCSHSVLEKSKHKIASSDILNIITRAFNEIL